MLKRWATIMLLGLIIIVSSMAQAQPGGGPRPTLPAPSTGGGAPGNLPINPQVTPAAPGINPNIPNLQITPGVPGINPNLPNLQLTVPNIPLMLPTMPTNWQDFVMPTGIPTSAADLQAALQALDVPYDVTLEAPIFENSQVAYTAVVGFGQTYLSTNVAPLYAAEFSTAELAQLTTLSAEAQQLTQITSQFPAEVQAILAQATGVAYGALLSDGVAVVYTGDCTGEQCSIAMDNLQFTITEGSLGGYGLYRSTNVTSADQALGLIRTTYPALAAVNLAPTTTTSGYAFSAVSGEAANATLQAYYAGTMTVNNQTLVYALVGIGTGYVDIVRP